MKTIPAVKHWCSNNGELVYDLGQNMTGWARITVTGDTGAEITLRYGERLNNDGELDQQTYQVGAGKHKFETMSSYS